MSVNCVFGSVARVGGLFVVGSSEILGSNVARFSVAGARAIDKSSSSWLNSIINGLAPGSVVVSGLALGSDSVAFRSALARGLRCIAVLPCGFNHITPRQNLGLAQAIVRAGGCLVSEYPPSARASRSQFVARNKIIAQLGKFLIVPQFEIKSGTRHTVDFAQALNKFIIIQNANYSGNKFIINNSSYSTIIK